MTLHGPKVNEDILKKYLLCRFITKKYPQLPKREYCAVMI